MPSSSPCQACVAVFAGGRFYIVDVGRIGEASCSGASAVQDRRRAADALSLESHVGDLRELNLQGIRAAGLRRWTSMVDLVSGNVIKASTTRARMDQGYRTEHHTDRVMPPATWPMVPQAITLEGPETPARTGLGWYSSETVSELRLSRSITRRSRPHAPLSRFDYKGRSALITGDLKYIRRSSRRHVASISWCRSNLHLDDSRAGKRCERWWPNERCGDHARHRGLSHRA